MIEIRTSCRIGWLAAAALAAVTVFCAGPAPAGFGSARMTSAAAIEHCRAEATRRFVVDYEAAGSPGFADCMAARDH